MAKNGQNPKRVTWLELRQQYPDVPFGLFVKLIEEVSLADLNEEGMEILHLLLREEDEKGKAAKTDWEKLVGEKLKTIVSSMMHCELNINIPDSLDREHVQAYVVYGLVQPASARTFAGKRTVSQRTIKDFVKRKLGSIFNSAKHDQAENWLIQQGVVNVGNGYTLNTKAKKTGVTPEGRAIILEARRLLSKYLPAKQE